MGNGVINKISSMLNNPLFRFNYESAHGLLKNMSDEEFLMRKFKLVFGYELNLKNPRTFNEKLQWLKLYNRRPEYTIMVDKYKVREHVKSVLGEEYLIPLLGAWDDPNEIIFEDLPDQFVLKCNHNSGLGMCICKDKSKLNVVKAKSQLKKGINQNYFLLGREWPYKDVPHKIIAEKYMEDANSSDGLIDYKLMCFNGEVKCSFTCTDRFNGKGLKVTFFDRDWKVMPFEREYPKSQESIQKPVNYEKMIQFAEKLSAGIPFVRMDFYEINGNVYFGEYTFFPGDGFERFTPFSADTMLGNWITLP